MSPKVHLHQCKLTPYVHTILAIGVNTESDELTCSRLERRAQELEEEFGELKAGQKVALRLDDIAGDYAKVAFYTEFPSYALFKATGTHPCLKRTMVRKNSSSGRRERGLPNFLLLISVVLTDP